MTGATLAAQTGSTPAPAFEVASVKRNISGRVGAAIRVPPAGQLSFTNVMLRILIREAYQVDAYAEDHKLDPGAFASIVGRPAGGPQPDVPRFDVIAKPPDASQPPERRAMMRQLLEDRFKLRVHREMRRMPVYAMRVAREGRLGPKLIPSQFDCNTYLAERRAGRAAEEPVDASGRSLCLPGLVKPSVVPLRFAGPVAVLAQRLEPYVGRPVVDATGLAGRFAWDVEFAARADAQAGAPSLFTVIQEELGLRLEARQDPVEVLVIDHVELPTPD